MSEAGGDKVRMKKKWKAPQTDSAKRAEMINFYFY